MTIALKRLAPITHMFANEESIPNNPALPLVLYAGAPDPEAAIEQTHEALGITRGRATVRFGGNAAEPLIALWRA